MDLDSIGRFIGSYGFPILACIALFWQNTKQEETHKEIIQNLTKVIQDNTSAIDKILIYIESLDKFMKG